MIRAAAILIAAMHMSRPQMPKAEAERYAKALNEAALKHKFDPLLAVAIVHFETQWYPTLISPDGEDVGLGQVRARYVGACRDDADPVNAPSEACLEVKESLRDGVINIGRMGTVIGANIDFCKKHTKSDAPERWLAGYQGYGDPDKRIFCKPGEKTVRVMNYYKDLIQSFAPLPKPKKAKKAPAKAAPDKKKVQPKAAPKKPSSVVKQPKVAVSKQGPRRTR